MNEYHWELIRILLHPESDKHHREFHKSVIHFSTLFQNWKEVAERMLYLKNVKVVSIGTDGRYYLSDKGAKLWEEHNENIGNVEKTKSLELQRLQLDVEKLINDVADYDETKQRAKDSMLLARLSVAIALATLVLEWMCKKPG